MSKERTNDSRQKTLGLSVKRIREQRNLSQEKLAEAADIHTSYIGQIERGLRHPSLKVLFRIADALNIKISELFKDMDAKKIK